MPPIKRPAPSPEQRVRRIKVEVNRAVGQSAAIDADRRVNRSTRTRHILKAKADAFDTIADIAAGRA